MSIIKSTYLTRFKISHILIFMRIVRINKLNNLPACPVSLNNTAFFDIETTGFSRDYCTIYMIGAMAVDTAKLEAEVVLFFAETPAEEKEVIIDFFNWLGEKEISHLITFNGASFDVPFVNARIEKLELDCAQCDFSRYNHLDIYKKLSIYKDLFGLANCKQKSIEGFLGIGREDEMNGGQLIEVYKRYAKNPTDEDRHLLIIHNYEDVLGMLALLPALNYPEIFENTSSYIDSLEYSISSDAVVYTCTLNYPVPVAINYTHPAYGFELDLCGDHLEFRAPLYDGKLHYFYKDFKDYYYLPLEGYAIPKVIASGVDKNSRIPATESNCYILAEFTETNASNYFTHCMETFI